MFQILFFFIFFSPFLMSSSNTNNNQRIIPVKQTTTSFDSKKEIHLFSYIDQSKLNTTITNDNTSSQNDNDDNNNDDKSLLHQREEQLNYFLDDLYEIENERHKGLSKKSGHSKLSFPNKEALEEKINPQGLKELNSKKKLDLKRLSVLTVQAELLAQSGKNSNTSDSDSENISNFNSHVSDKNNSSQAAKK